MIDKFKGCILGGAIGDALGYPVEFIRYGNILKRFGENGITEYYIDPEESNKAIISDDTQMTLFTAAGLLDAKDSGEYIESVYKAYKEWYKTQYGSCWMDYVNPLTFTDRLMYTEELHVARYPGCTCTQALGLRDMGTTLRTLNESKGCGGIMRVAPIALFFESEDEEDVIRVSDLSAEVAAMTHSHILGYASAWVLVYIVNSIIYLNMNLKDAIKSGLKAIRRKYPNNQEIDYMVSLVIKAAKLAQNISACNDQRNIKELGTGSVGEEALAIAVYCSLRYQDNFDKAIIASVNHSGDSDSTGAITGNLLGAVLGKEVISDKWLDDLELLDLISEYAEELYNNKTKL